MWWRLFRLQESNLKSNEGAKQEIVFEENKNSRKLFGGVEKKKS